MKNNYFLLLFFASFCCLSIQCKKENEFAKLPDPSTTGAGIFACQLNGEAWPVDRSGMHDIFFDYKFGVFAFNYRIDSDDTPGDNEIITITTDKINGLSYYVIPYSQNQSTNFFAVRINSNRYFSTDKINEKGYAIINISRFDTIQRVMSGTFAFSLMDKQGKSVMQVTNGRFDLRY